MCQDATHIQGGSHPSQLAHSDTLKKYISLLSLDPVKLTIKVNHNEKAEVASFYGPVHLVTLLWALCTITDLGV